MLHRLYTWHNKELIFLSHDFGYEQNQQILQDFGNGLLTLKVLNFWKFT